MQWYTAQEVYTVITTDEMYGDSQLCQVERYAECIAVYGGDGVIK